MPPSLTKYETQEPPFAVQVELTEGCNLRCGFCGLNGIREADNDFKFMTPALGRRVASLIADAGWSVRVEFAMHGEPTMNPDAEEIVRAFRETLPGTHLMMTSNGGGLLADPSRATRLLAHLNVLALDWYEAVQIVPKFLARYDNTHPPRHYPKDPDANPHRRRKLTQHDLVIIQDIKLATEGTHATLNNHAGCGAPPNRAGDGKRCAKPFRELSVRWDGSVALCCNDWRGVYRCGSLATQTLDQVWNGPAMGAARRKLYHGRRDFGPCDGCDAVSYRVGLLPDKKGKGTIPEPGPADDRAVAAAVGRGPLTLPVLRPWELQDPGAGS